MTDIVSILDAIKGAINKGASTRRAVRIIGKANGIPLDVRRRLNKYDFVNEDFNTKDTELLNTEAVKPGTTQTTEQLDQNIKTYKDEMEKAQKEQAYQNKLNSVSSALYDPQTENFTYFDENGNKVEGLDPNNVSSLTDIQNDAKEAKFQSDVNNKLKEWYINYYNKYNNNKISSNNFNLKDADLEWFNKAIQALIGTVGNNTQVTQDGKIGNQTLTAYKNFIENKNNQDVDKAALLVWYGTLNKDSNDEFSRIYDNRNFANTTYNQQVDVTGVNKNFNKTSYKQGGKMNRINYFLTGGAVAPQQSEAQDIQTQVIQLVQKAMLGDKQSTQAIQAIMEKAQQGDEQATLIAQMIQAVIQQMQGQAKAAKRGAKLSYLHSLKTGCPEGYTVSYNKKGGHLCKECLKKHADGGEVSKEDGRGTAEHIKAVVAQLKKKYPQFTEDQLAGKTPIIKNGQKYFMNGDGELIEVSKITLKSACGSKLKKMLISGKKIN